MTDRVADAAQAKATAVDAGADGGGANRPGLPFVVLTAGRSRSAWLSKFLSYRGYEVGHDQLRYLRSIEDARMWLSQPWVGTCETAAAPWWRLIRHLNPETRIAIVRRPVREVVESFSALLGVAVDRKALTADIEQHARRLDIIERRVPGVLVVEFKDLATAATCGRLLTHCTGLPSDPDWWCIWGPVNWQNSLVAQLRYMEAHRPALDRLAAEAKRHTLALLGRHYGARPDRGEDGVVIAEEPFADFWADAQRLIAEHVSEAGPREGVTLDLNLPFIEKLAEVGALQIVTARANGRMFGYLVTVVGPSAEDKNLIVGTQTVFFVSPDFRGLGPRLQRSSIDMLTARGVGEVIMRAGVRGSGPKLGALYRRLGAVDHGHLFSLIMKAA